VNRRPSSNSTSRIAVEAAYNEHRRFVEVFGEVVPRCQHALLLRFSFAGRGRRRMKAFFEILEGAFISDLNLLFDLRILHHDEAPMLGIAAARRAGSGLEDFTDEYIRNGVGFQP